MATTIEIRDPGDLPQRKKVKCVHLPNNMCMYYWNDGTMTLQGHDTLIIIDSLDSRRDGFLLSMTPRESPSVCEEHHEWKDGICQSLSDERPRLRRKSA